MHSMLAVLLTPPGSTSRTLTAMTRQERDFRHELAAQHATPWQDKYVYAITAGCFGGLSVLFGGVSSKANPLHTPHDPPYPTSELTLPFGDPTPNIDPNARRSSRS